MMTAITVVIALLLIQTSCCRAQSDDTFVIYNADKNKCLLGSYRGPWLYHCNPSDSRQQVRWTSEGQILNLGLIKCLGAGGKSPGSPLQWYICDDKSDIQKWECRNDTLFGLKNESLYLSPVDDVETGELRLSKDTGVKSRWTIHGTTDGLCSRTYQDLFTVGGNGRGRPCHFPFQYNKKWYAGCITELSSTRQLWCSTDRDYHASESWGYCPTKSTKNWKKSPVTGVFYQVYSESALTWHQARKSCQQQGADLLSVTEPHEQTFISGITLNVGTKLWTGLNSLDATSGWRWSSGNPFRYLRWAPGEPSSEPGHLCGILNPSLNSNWQSEVCSKRLGYICQKGSSVPTISPEVHTGSCSSPWIPYSGHCYLLTRTKKTWKEAQMECRKEEGDLVSILNIEEQSFVISQLGYLETDELWTGLNDRKTQLLFEWSDQSTVTFTMWEVQEPTHAAILQEDCALVRGKEGKWADQVCENKYGFICKKKANSKPVDTEVSSPGCKAGWSKYGYYCYLVGSETKTFDEATQMCNKTGSFLVDVPNRIENAFLISLVGSRSEKYFWIGLSNQKDRYTFKWTNRGKVDFTHFNAGMPGNKQGCVAMTTGTFAGLWDVLSCTTKEKYICKHLAEGVVLTQAPPTSPSPSCHDGWTPVGTRGFCFKYYNRPLASMKTWFEALDFCQAIGGDLLSIHSAHDIQWSSVGYDGFGWIGFSAQDPNAGYVWSDGSSSSYENWASGEPNNRNNLENCASADLVYWGDISSQGKWRDYHCETPKNWLCEIRKGVTPKDPDDDIPKYNVTDDGWIEYKGSQYYINSDEEFSMDDARDFCVKKHGGLVVINDESERVFLWQQIYRNLNWGSFYIGLSVDLDRSFQWMDGSPVVFQGWEKNQPAFKNYDETCAKMTQDQGLWESCNCGTELYFICKRSGSPAVNTTVAPTAAPKGGCAPDWMKFQGKCYQIGSDKKMWRDARQYCRNLGGNLASVLNKNVQAFLTIKMVDSTTDLWIGLNSINDERRYLWTDGRAVKFLDWAQKEPLGFYFPRYWKNQLKRNHYKEDRCVVMSSSPPSEAGEWKSISCNNTHGFICKRDIVWRQFKPQWLPEGGREGASGEFVVRTATPCGQNYGLEFDEICLRGGKSLSFSLSAQDHLIDPGTTVTPQTYYKFGNNSLTVVDKNLTWEEARQHCKADGANLVSIRDTITQAFIELQSYQLKEPVWIGLNRDETDGYFRWIDNWHLNLERWQLFEPKHNFPCVYVDVDGSWKTAPCNQTYHSVCKHSTDIAPSPPSQYPGQCPEAEGWGSMSWLPFRGHCYAFQVDWESWADASKACMKRDASLVSIEDPMEADFIKNNLELLQDEAESFWIGLHQNHKEKWLWTDKAVLDYSNWAEGQPVNKRYECAQITASNAQWHSSLCYRYKSYICKIAKAIAPTQNTTTTAFVGPADPRVYVSMAVVMVLAVLTVMGVAAFIYRKSSSQFIATFENPLYFKHESSQPDNIDNFRLTDNMETCE